MPDVTHIVETYLAYDRPTQNVTPEWVDFRLDWFHRYTLKSLLNQTFKDFRIFVQCGERHRPRIEAYPWSQDVTVCFGQGQAEYAKIDSDYLAITRIDSDDLFHRENIAEVHENLRLSRRREVLCWKTRIVWDYVNGFITNNHRRPTSPFFTHIFQKAIYRNWTLFAGQHFLAHGSGGAGDVTAYPLKPGRVCVVKHGWNNSVLKRGQTWPVLKTPAEVEKFQAGLELKNPGVKVCFDRAVIARTLDPFAVTPEMIP